MNFNKFQKISISFFVVIFLLSTFYFLFSDRALAGGASGSWDNDMTTIDLNCQTNPGAYPWCQEAQQGPSALIGKFYIIALGLAVAAAFGVLIYGAILWTLSGAVTSKQDAKEWIWGAIWGLVLLLAAYLILWTINPDLIKLKSPEELFQIPAGLEAAPTTPYSGLSSSNNPYDTPSEILQGQGMSEEEARRKFDEAWVTVKQGVVLNGIREKTVDEVIALCYEGKNGTNFGTVDCVVTAGTEEGIHRSGEYSHANGYKVDVRSQYNGQPTNLTKYIESVPPGWQKLKQGDMNGKCFTNECYLSPRGAIYNKENNHWDILVK